MKELLPYISNWFFAKKRYLVAFAEADSRVEGWFKAEMIVLLNKLKKHGVIDNFGREFNLPIANTRQRNQIDFRIVQGGQIYLCEMKALCISRAAGTPRNLQFYFRDDGLGIIKDFRKLDALTTGETKYVLGFVYPSPDQKIWDQVMGSLAEDLRHWECVTRPQDYPPFLFMPLWTKNSNVFQRSIQ